MYLTLTVRVRGSLLSNLPYSAHTTHPHNPIFICITSQEFGIVTTFSADWSTLVSATYTATNLNTNEFATITTSDAPSTTLTWAAGP